jgi:hypothetical protein
MFGISRYRPVSDLTGLLIDVPIQFGTDVARQEWVKEGHLENPAKYFPSLKPLMPLNF